MRLPDFLALINVGALPIFGTKPRLADASVGTGAVLSGGWMRSIQDHTLYVLWIRSKNCANRPGIPNRFRRCRCRRTRSRLRTRWGLPLEGIQI